MKPLDADTCIVRIISKTSTYAVGKITWRSAFLLIRSACGGNNRQIWKSTCCVFYYLQYVYCLLCRQIFFTSI